MKLHLGVVDVPYTDSPEALTTGDVAEILEDKYHVIEVFYEQHGEDVILPAIEGAIEGVMESMLTGAPFGSASFASAGEPIKKAFHDFITNREMDALGYPGVPTQASLDGVNHRFAHPYAKRASRPSFRDTGAYLDSFTAWVDDKK